MSYRFSVILPVYNKAPYVAKAIRSVLSQTCQDFELIVVDDGSKDDSAAIAEVLLQQCDVRKCRLLRQSNAGVSTARNNGVAASQGEYLCFLDADDWWKPTFLEEMKRLIEEFPQAGIYGAGYTIVNDTKRKTRIAPIGVEPDFVKGEINYCKVYAKTLCMPLTSISVAVPRWVFEEMNGFKPQLKLGEDFDLWIRIALKYKVILLNKPLAYYNQDADAQNRAVGTRLYKPEEHMLFTDYGNFMNNPDFRFLFERLALYGLLPYYLNNVNSQEITKILDKIDWSRHEQKYRFYYRIVPRSIVKIWFLILRKLSNLKNKIKL
ncbi:glycosyltransferase family 2 protein [Bacteroides heparinolyticus]|uniref:glycosyltransferase family 2 protein n=1 Tax=Prevotella heparinolytica TaxID=28113 RepID=UPI0035A1BABF